MRLPARPPRWSSAVSRSPPSSRASSRSRACMVIAIPADIRVSKTCKSVLPTSRTRGPDSWWIRAFLHFSRPSGSRPSRRNAARAATFINKMPRGSTGTGRRRAPHSCGCSSVGRARPRHGRGHGFEPRLPLHFRVCPGTTRRARAVGTAKRGCARGRSPCAARAPGRSPVTRAWTQPKVDHALVAQTEERLPCKQWGARSSRRLGHQSRRVRLAGRGHLSFKEATRVRIPYTTPMARSWQGTRFAGRPPQVRCLSPAPDSGSLAQWQSVSLSRRGPRVRSPHGPPYPCRNSSEVERCVEGAGVGVSNTPCGTRSKDRRATPGREEQFRSSASACVLWEHGARTKGRKRAAQLPGFEPGYRRFESCRPRHLPAPVRPRGRAPTNSSRPWISGADRSCPKDAGGRSMRPGRPSSTSTRRIPWNS